MIEHAVIAPTTRAVPRHVAILIDGNVRWARERGLPILEGHRAGARALRETVREALGIGIELVTFHICPEETRLSGDGDMRGLLECVSLLAENQAADLVRDNIRVRTIGNADRLPQNARESLADLVNATQANTGLLLTIAADYGARAEIRDAIQAVARDVARGTLKAADVNEKTLAAYLSTAALPDPDLLIRTGGELRLANFLLYQAAYSELWSTSCHWPDFSASLLQQAVADFATRQRRFGS